MSSQTEPAEVTIFNSPWRKYRVFRTIGLYATFMALGLSASVVGTTIVSMEVLLHTDTKTISTAFAGGSLGYLTGSVVCGLVYGRLNKELVFTVAGFGTAAAVALASFAPHVFVFVAACVVQGFFMGAIDTGGQPYILKLWENHKLKDPLMQAAHLIWSVGSTCGPFIIRPFLVDVSRIANSNVSEVANNVTGNATDAPDEARVGIVRYAYVAIASLILVCSTLFFVAFFLLKPSCSDRTRRNETTEGEVTHTRSYRRFRFSLLVFMFFCYLFYSGVENHPGAFIALFVVKGLGWPNKDGALATAAFWGALGVGRLVGVPIAAALSPRNMLILDFSLVLVGSALLFFIPYLEAIVWVGITMGGLGLGTIFPTGVLILEQYVEVTGAAASVLLAASSLGGMGFLPLSGFLVDKFGPMTFVYVFFVFAVVDSSLFLGVYLYAERNRRTVKIHSVEATDGDQPTKEGLREEEVVVGSVGGQDEEIKSNGKVSESSEPEDVSDRL